VERLPPIAQHGTVSPENVLLVKTVAPRLSPNLPAGCFWISVQDGPPDTGRDRYPTASPADARLCEFQRAVGGA
jgi:hypothetical protein